MKRPAASIRFKLTAWYAALLAISLAIVAVGVLRLTEQRLLADMDDRLFRTGEDIANLMERRLEERTAFGVPTSFEEVVPALGAFTSRGLLVQIIDADGVVIRRSEAAPATRLADPPTAEAEPRARRLTTETGGWAVRVVAYPLLLVAGSDPPTPLGAVIVGERMDTYLETLASLRQVLLWTSLVGLALAAVGGWVLGGRALRPVDRITAAAAAIAAAGVSGLSTRLEAARSGDELGRLAATFNAMLDRIEQTFAAQRRFVADASHELRTPLAAIRGNTDVLSRQLAALPADLPLRDDLVAAAEDIGRESRRMGRLLDDLLLLARGDAVGDAGLRLERAPVRLDEVGAEALRVAAGLATGQHLSRETTPVTIVGDRDRLLQVALALLDNALRHTPAGAPVVLAVHLDGQGRPLLEVRDGGEGIPAEHLPRIFDRFYRVDDARGRGAGGTGLGLAIARAIARAHGGEIVTESVVGVGSRFALVLPAAARSGARSVQPSPAAALPERRAAATDRAAGGERAMVAALSHPGEGAPARPDPGEQVGR